MKHVLLLQMLQKTCYDLRYSNKFVWICGGDASKTWRNSKVPPQSWSFVATIWYDATATGILGEHLTNSDQSIKQRTGTNTHHNNGIPGLFNIAMENGPFIDDFPIKTSIYKGFSMAMLNNQMVNILVN